MADHRRLVYAPATLRADVLERGHGCWISGEKREDSGYALAFQTGSRLWLKKLCVLDESRGMGIGQALMSAARAAHPGADTMWSLVNQANQRAIDFYRGLGFKAEPVTRAQMGRLSS